MSRPHFSFSTLLILFVLGFSILSIEILGIRILAPYVGVTMPVWASLIGITLFGSALGYYLGGHIADKTRHRNVFLILTAVTTLLIIAIPFLRGLVSLFAPLTSYAVGALLGSCILFLLPIVSLSTLTTYTICTHVKGMPTIGQVHGDLYAVATLGSIVGLFGTSYILIPFLAIPTILYGLGVSIFFLGVTVALTANTEN